MIETLYDNEWVSVRRLVLPNFDIEGYVYAHESRCAGRIATIMPFRVIEDKLCQHVTHAADDCQQNNGQDEPDAHIEFLMHDELIPCWHTTQPCLCTISGYFDADIDDVGCRSTTVRTLLRVAGYRVNASDLIDLGYSFTSRSADTIHFIYAMDLTDVEPTTTGDSTCRWVNYDELVVSSDSQSHVAWTRLLAWFIERLHGNEDGDDR